jgi:hypothetical protein
MAYDPTTAALAESYLEVLGGGAMARNALLACAAALRLDDEVARQAIALAAGSNGSTDALLRRIKDLGCVARRWDGTWYVADDVRPYLVDRFEREVPAAERVRLRDLLAEHADARMGTLAPDGQITTWQARAASLEAAYQLLHSSQRAKEGASRLVATWQQARDEAKTATCEAVEALAPELERHLERLPDEVLFLRGMAAYRRTDRKAAARRYFETVWRHGPGDEIHAIAAHLFGRTDSRHRAVYEGRTYYFCCGGCRERFVAAPASFS